MVSTCLDRVLLVPPDIYFSSLSSSLILEMKTKLIITNLKTDVQSLKNIRDINMMIVEAAKSCFHAARMLGVFSIIRSCYITWYRSWSNTFAREAFLSKIPIAKNNRHANCQVMVTPVGEIEKVQRSCSEIK